MVPAAYPATTDQTGVGRIASTLPLPSRPTAVNVWLAPVPKATGFGVTVRVASVPELTVTDAKPATLPGAQSAVLQALTVLTKVPAVGPAVNRPEPLMVPPLATTDQVGVMVMGLPLASRPAAVNSCVAPMARFPTVGVTMTVRSGPAVTVTDAAPEILPMTARTVPAKVPATVPAVNRPELLMVPPPAATDQVGAIETGLPVASWPAAVNCWVALVARVVVPGVTVMVASGPAVTVTVAVAVTPPTLATTVLG